MLLSAVLSATTMAIVVNGALLRNELKSDKNRSVKLAESLRKKLMSENYDYMPPESDELESSEIHKSPDKQKKETDIYLRTRDDDTSSTNERDVIRIDNSNDEHDSLNDGDQHMLHALQRSRLMRGDKEDDPNVKMPQHERNEPNSNYLSKDKISSRVDENMNWAGDEERHNKHDVPNQNMEDEKSDKLRGGKNHGSWRDKASDVEYKHDELRHVRGSMREYIARDKPKSYDKYDVHSLKYNDHELHMSANVRNDQQNDQQLDNAELRRDKIDSYRYDKYNDLHHNERGHKGSEMTYDNEKRKEKKDFPPYSRQDQPNDLKSKKRHDFEKRDDMTSEGSVDSRNTNLETIKTNKLRQDKRDYLISNTHENKRQDNIINDKLRYDKREELHISPELEMHHDSRNNDRDDIRQGEEKQHISYKMRFEKRGNVLPDDLRQENTDKFKFDRMKHDKQNDGRLDQPEHTRNELKYDERNNLHLNQKNQDQSDKLWYQKSNEERQSNDVFRHINHQLDKSNYRHEKHDGSQNEHRPNKNDMFREHNRDNFRQDDMAYEKINKERHNKRDDSQFNLDKNSKQHAKNEHGSQNDQRPNKNDKFREHIHDNYRQDNMKYEKTNKERHNKRDDSQLNNDDNAKHHAKNEHDTQNDRRPNKNDKFREHNRDNFRQDDMTYEKTNKERHNKRDDSQLNNDDNAKHHAKNEHDSQNDRRPNKNDKFREHNRDHFRQDDMTYEKTNKERHNKRDDSQLNNDDKAKHHAKNQYGSQYDRVPNKNDKFREHNRDNFRQDDMTYEKTNKKKHNKRYDSQFDNDENSKHHAKNERGKYPKENNKRVHDGKDSRQDRFVEKKKETDKIKREHDQIKDDKLRQDFVRDNRGNNGQSLKQKQDKSERDKPGNLKSAKFDRQPKTVPLKYDKLEKELEKEVLRITPFTKNYKNEYNSAKLPDKYKKNNNRNDNYKNDSNRNDKKTDDLYKNENHKKDKYKYINNEYKYKKYEYKENDRKKKIKRRADIRIHPDIDIAKQDTENDTSSEFVSRDHESHEDHVVQMTYNVSIENDKYVPESNSTNDVSLPRDGEKVQGEALNVSDVPAVPVNATRRNAKKYKMLKMPVSSRRASDGTAKRVVQEEGLGGVALVPLDGGVLPSFQLPAARRQYMPSDHDSEYQVDIYGEEEEIPGLNSYEEPDLNRINVSEIQPPGLTARVQTTLDELYSLHVEGPINQ